MSKGLSSLRARANVITDHPIDKLFATSVLKPPRVGGGATFANILPGGGAFARFWLKLNQKLANVGFASKIQ